MDYFQAISRAAANSAISDEQLIAFTNGMIIVVLLLVIYLCLIRLREATAKPTFPQQCNDCLFLYHAKAGYCRKKCLFHPSHKGVATTSFYQKKAPASPQKAADSAWRSQVYSSMGQRK